MVEQVKFSADFERFWYFSPHFPFWAKLDAVLTSTRLRCTFPIAFTPVLRAIADTLLEEEMVHYWPGVDPQNVFYFDIRGSDTATEGACITVTRGPKHQAVLKMEIAHSLQAMKYVQLQGKVGESGWRLELQDYHSLIEDKAVRRKLEGPPHRTFLDPYQEIGYV